MSDIASLETPDTRMVGLGANHQRILEGIVSEINKIEDEKKKHQDELSFLKTYVKQAEANVKYYYDLLDKIDAAEKAKAAAAAAAAAAKKS